MHDSLNTSAMANVPQLFYGVYADQVQASPGTVPLVWLVVQYPPVGGRNLVV